jgi:hypothetical protein
MRFFAAEKLLIFGGVKSEIYLGKPYNLFTGGDSNVKQGILNCI